MEEYNHKKGIDRKTLEEAIDYVFNQRPESKERKIKMTMYCLDIDGLRNMNPPDSLYFNICSNSHCVNCRHLANVLKEEVEKYIDGSKEKDL